MRQFENTHPGNARHAAFYKLFLLHQTRHPERGVERLEAEVASYIRRATNRPPDTKALQHEGDLSAQEILQAYTYARGNHNRDLTELYPRQEA